MNYKFDLPSANLLLPATLRANKFASVRTNKSRVETDLYRQVVKSDQFGSFKFATSSHTCHAIVAKQRFPTLTITSVIHINSVYGYSFLQFL